MPCGLRVFFRARDNLCLMWTEPYTQGAQRWVRRKHLWTNRCSYHANVLQHGGSLHEALQSWWIRLTGKGRPGSVDLSAVKWKRSRHSARLSSRGSLALSVAVAQLTAFWLCWSPISNSSTWSQEQLLVLAGRTERYREWVRLQHKCDHQGAKIGFK